MHIRKGFFERIWNSFLYKIVLRFPYSKIRIAALRGLGHTVGCNVYIPSDITITQNFINFPYRLMIGDRVSIAPGCILVLSSHPNFSKIRPYIMQSGGDIIIEDDAWIGAGSIILPGITIGRCAVVGAGAIVTRNVPDKAIVVGNPARVLKYIDITARTYNQ